MKSCRPELKEAGEKEKEKVACGQRKKIQRYSERRLEPGSWEEVKVEDFGLAQGTRNVRSVSWKGPRSLLEKVMWRTCTPAWPLWYGYMQSEQLRSLEPSSLLTHHARKSMVECPVRDQREKGGFYLGTEETETERKQQPAAFPLAFYVPSL